MLEHEKDAKDRFRPLNMRPAPPSTVRRTREFKWLKDHAREFSGSWVAVEGDRLLATASDLGAIHLQLEESHPEADPLLHYCE